MSNYGVPFYGVSSSKYGAAPLVDFDASPFAAKAVDYGTISLSWTKPSGSWDNIVVVRNPYGFPTTPDDGLAIVVGTNSAYSAISVPYVDTNLVQGKPHYYSIFVRATVNSEWYRAGDAIGISVKNFGTNDYMYDYVPMPYKIPDLSAVVGASSVSDANAELKNVDLYNFLKVFAFEYDYIKTMAENSSKRFDIENVDGRLIPLLMNEFGLKFEKELGITHGRQMLRNAAKIYLAKGSSLGIKSYVEAFTGYSCSLGTIKNLMLTNDDASFEYSLGNWAAVSPTGTTYTATLTKVASDNGVLPYFETGSPANYPNSQLGFLKVESAATSFNLTCGQSNVKLNGIRVTAGTTYTASFKVRSKTTTCSAAAGIAYYDKDGVFISSSFGTASTTSNSTWQTRSVSYAAPSTAVYAIVDASFSSNSGTNTHYVDAVQFEAGASATTYADSRRIDINLLATRTNLLKNPGFEHSTSYWTPVGGTISNSNLGEATTGSLYRADIMSSVDMASPDPSVFSVSSEIIAVTPGDVYTVSAYVGGLFSMPPYSRVQLDWYISGTVVMSSYGRSSAPLGTTWQRVSLTAEVPAGVDSCKVTIYPEVCAFGDSLLVDSVMLEKTGLLLPYFDGEAGYYQTADLAWTTGTTGPSYYYKNRASSINRLMATLEDYVPVGSSWAVFSNVS